MYCDECQQRPANVHLIRVVNGNKVERHLCEQCATKTQNQLGLHFENDFSFPNIIGSILQSDSFPSVGKILDRGVSCDKCGLTHNQFVQSGRLGCDECYRHFGERLDALLRRVQGSTTHSGKLPKYSGRELRQKMELQKLKDRLKQHIALEEFEEAAQLRDEIKGLEEKFKSEEG